MATTTDDPYYHAHDLAKFGEIGKNRSELAEKFFAWYGAVFADGALSAREKSLIALGVAPAVQCPYCVDAGPDRREMMSRETIEECLAALARTAIPTVDITGGAPELHPHFRFLVEECARLGRHVIDRCNLTVLETPGLRDLPAFLAAHR